jgi:hypothetical protein
LALTMTLRQSDQVGEAFFHATELTESQPEEECDDNPAKQEPGHIDSGFAPEDGPAETVNDADHWIE